MEKKKMLLFFALFLMAAVLISCGKVAENKSEVEVVANNPLSQDQLNSAKALDAKLATLESHAEAKQILKDVIGTVSVSFKDDNKLSAMSDSGFDSLLDALADKEIAVRGHGLKALSAGQVEAALISPEKIAATVDNLSSSPVSSEEVAERVKETQKELRELLPNISPTGSQGMTPIEATMVSYAMYAAGSGETSPEAISLDIPKTTAVTFIKEIAK